MWIPPLICSYGIHSSWCVWQIFRAFFNQKKQWGVAYYKSMCWILILPPPPPHPPPPCELCLCGYSFLHCSYVCPLQFGFCFVSCWGYVISTFYWHFSSESWPRWLSRMRVRLVIRSRVPSPPGLATDFCGDWSQNIFWGHSLPFADSRWAVVSFWWMKCTNAG